MTMSDGGFNDINTFLVAGSSHDNAYLLFILKNGNIRLVMSETSMRKDTEVENPAVLNEPHYHCFTWKSGEYLRVSIPRSQHYGFCVNEKPYHRKRRTSGALFTLIVVCRRSESWCDGAA